MTGVQTCALPIYHPIPSTPCSPSDRRAIARRRACGRATPPGAAACHTRAPTRPLVRPDELAVAHTRSLTQTHTESSPAAPFYRTPASSVLRRHEIRRRRPPTAASHAPFHPSRPIYTRRSRLDLGSFKSKSSDLEPTAQIKTYRFAVVFLLKSPRTLLKTTRGPRQFRNICR